MTLPYQCLAACTRSAAVGNGWLLFGATGSELVVQSSTGAASHWSPEIPTPEVKEPALEGEHEGPPGKRVKLTPVTEPKPNISHLKTTQDGQHLVAVTAEDKCIRVFQIDDQCRLEQLSQRCMAKRPSSITLTADDTTILCADKFGDVYSLPLLPSPEDEQGVILEPNDEQKKFAPSASVLTVHSGRNRKALEEQLKQAEKGKKQVKETPKFKHQLIIGHVSMLTDIACTKVGSRSYILTADRDEHIRVSRGIPQAHIIEGFCQGHEEFVSRVCFAKAGRLVSGGGGPYLYVWDWLSFRLLEKLPLQGPILEHYKGHPFQAGATDFKVAVSRIWSVPNSAQEVDEVLVACEGVPALLSFKLGGSSGAGKVLPLDGNVLDLSFIEVDGGRVTAAVSIDHVHKPGSTQEVRQEPGTSRLQYLCRNNSGEWEHDRTLAEALEGFGQTVPDEEQDLSTAGEEIRGTADDKAKALRDLLYGIENLRKRPGAED
ncbi:tRNA (guanine-N(7)-)-methyltransferase non-catalytic subunit trm82 [Didymosphaeria variabile]|uniref:tRNA (Guanine-N(7)-)-methyltransferase non-catalytic subunit trm82 n=1 Tax=Didymosphaeria variabile TaxID=1932322 RepID=A0A9W8XC34_9PLEO|nr:tRNA (guanine-N(7)-)-methyltransferase non-catalytic subunit trm82 [Didymosphaeria variabile]KAJ4345790.1 tRNA (guanine-N(7)-)-methyltransferase non-catalytic subunit trm82 [Didymosphaeria variabile]